MPIQAIQANDTGRGMYIPTMHGMLIGAAAGFVGKYALPLTKEELNSREYKNVKDMFVKEGVDIKTELSAAQKAAKQCKTAIDLVVRHARPTGFFLITGAIAGAIIAGVHNIMKPEIKMISGK